MIAVTMAFALINIACQVFQEPLSYVELVKIEVFDSTYYYEMAEQLSQGESPESDAPFVYRIGTPLLIALFSRATYS